MTDKLRSKKSPPSAVKAEPAILAAPPTPTGAAATTGGAASAVKERPAPAVVATTGRPATKAADDFPGLDQTIARANDGQVAISPAKAIAMAGKLYASGKYGPASRVCRQILQRQPRNADAHNILGVTLNALGEKREAVAELRRAIRIHPDIASYHSNLGEILRQHGDADEAAIELQESLRLEPNNPQARNNLGIVHYDRKEYDEAVAQYRLAIELQPDMAEAYNNLGNALRMASDREGAMEAYQNALIHREIYPEAYNNLGTLLHAERQHDEAEHALRRAIQQMPTYMEAHNNLANVYSAQKRDGEALRILGDALRIEDRHPTTLLIVSRIQTTLGNFDLAERAARIVIEDDPESVDAKVALGQLMHETDRYDEAIQILEDAIKSGADTAEAHNFYGVALKSVGRLDEAREQIMKSIELNDKMYGSFANLNDLVDFSNEDELFDKMKAVFDDADDLEADQLLPLHFAFGKALEDRGEHARALDHYITGGRMKRAQLDFSETSNGEFFDSIRAAFPRERFENRAYAGNSDDRPVFIVGMPRSGSTLTEQILSSHPEVYGAGEVKYLSRAMSQLRDRFPSLPRFPAMMDKVGPAQLELLANNYVSQITASSGGAARVTDKLLTNYYFVGLIHMLMPNAKIIHTRRDPVDTCLSAFTKLFKDDMPHSYDLGELGRYYGKYRQLMEHWEQVLPEGVMITVDYENTVEHTEREAKRLIEFIGLAWDDKCLAFHESNRPVKTASVAQVRKPIYKTAVKRWKKYGDGLKPLVDATAYRPE